MPGCQKLQMTGLTRSGIGCFNSTTHMTTVGVRRTLFFRFSPNHNNLGIREVAHVVGSVLRIVCRHATSCFLYYAVCTCLTRPSALLPGNGMQKQSYLNCSFASVHNNSLLEDVHSVVSQFFIATDSLTCC